MKSVHNMDETPPVIEQSFETATNLKRELSADIEMESIAHIEISLLAEDIQVKTREASHNTDLDMRKSLTIKKVL